MLNVILGVALLSMWPVAGLNFKATTYEFGSGCSGQPIVTIVYPPPPTCFCSDVQNTTTDFVESYSIHECFDDAGVTKVQMKHHLRSDTSCTDPWKEEGPFGMGCLGGFVMYECTNDTPGNYQTGGGCTDTSQNTTTSTAPTSLPPSTSPTAPSLSPTSASPTTGSPTAPTAPTVPTAQPTPAPSTAPLPTQPPTTTASAGTRSQRGVVGLVFAVGVLSIV